jgi:hypothetical protein
MLTTLRGWLLTRLEYGDYIDRLLTETERLSAVIDDQEATLNMMETANQRLREAHKATQELAEARYQQLMDLREKYCADLEPDIFIDNSAAEGRRWN